MATIAATVQPATIELSHHLNQLQMDLQVVVHTVQLLCSNLSSLSATLNGDKDPMSPRRSSSRRRSRSGSPTRGRNSTGGRTSTTATAGERAGGKARRSRGGSSGSAVLAATVAALSSSIVAPAAPTPTTVHGSTHAPPPPPMRPPISSSSTAPPVSEPLSPKGSTTATTTTTGTPSSPNSDVTTTSTTTEPGTLQPAPPRRRPPPQPPVAQPPTNDTNPTTPTTPSVQSVTNPPTPAATTTATTTTITAASTTTTAVTAPLVVTTATPTATPIATPLATPTTPLVTPLAPPISPALLPTTPVITPVPIATTTTTPILTATQASISMPTYTLPKATTTSEAATSTEAGGTNTTASGTTSTASNTANPAPVANPLVMEERAASAPASSSSDDSDAATTTSCSPSSSASCVSSSSTLSFSFPPTKSSSSLGSPSCDAAFSPEKLRAKKEDAEATAVLSSFLAQDPEEFKRAKLAAREKERLLGPNSASLTPNASSSSSPSVTSSPGEKTRPFQKLKTKLLPRTVSPDGVRSPHPSTTTQVTPRNTSLPRLNSGTHSSVHGGILHPPGSPSLFEADLYGNGVSSPASSNGLYSINETKIDSKEASTDDELAQRRRENSQRRAHSRSVPSSSPFPSPMASPMTVTLEESSDQGTSPARNLSPDQPRGRTASPELSGLDDDDEDDESLKHIFLSSDNKVKLNIGGSVFATTISTLSREQSMFTALLGGQFTPELDEWGAVFVDRDAGYFPYILNYLRDGKLNMNDLSPAEKKHILKEAYYYGVSGLVRQLEADNRLMKNLARRELSNEKEYKLLADVREPEMDTVLRDMTMFQGYELESWLLSSKKGHTHMIFSKKLSKGELMLLDRLQTQS